MIRKIFSILMLSLTLVMISNISHSADYGRKLTRGEKNAICDEMKRVRQEKSETPKNTSLGGGIIPDAVLSSIFNTTRKISDSTALVLVLGQALTCNAVHANKTEVVLLGVRLLSYPNLPVWFAGAIIYFMGFMLTLSITFYLVDIAFKLGFAVIMLPIGVALWPFPPTKDKLTILISIILKSAAIFTFLGLTVSFALNLIGEAGGGLEEVFAGIDRNETDSVSDAFSITSSKFLIVLFALIYSMKLIGSTIADYADKFFPDKAFGSASPMHGSLTQAMDFAKQKTVDPVKSWAGDVAKTQAGRATVGAGKLMTGQYNQQIKSGVKSAAHYAANPGEALDKSIQATGKLAGNIAGSAAKLANTAVVGVAGRAILGKKASQNLKNQLNEKIDQKVVGGINKLAQKAGAEVNSEVSAATDKLKQTAPARAIKKVANKATAGVNKVSTVAQKATNAVVNTYDKTLQTLDKAQNGVNKLKDNWSKSVENAIPSKASDNGVVKLAKKTLRGLAKAPVNIVAGVAKAPVKVMQTAVKMTNVNRWAKVTGSILEKVGDNMQRNKKTQAQRQAEAARREFEEEEREKKNAEQGE